MSNITSMFGTREHYIVQKTVFPKCRFSGSQLNRLGLVWYLLNSPKAHAPRGLDNMKLTQYMVLYHIYEVGQNYLNAWFSPFLN